MKKQTKHKIYALIVGIILTLICILLYFLDTSLEWNTLKITSCIFISLWLFFIPPTILYYYYKAKNSDMNYNIRLGVSIGLGSVLGILLAPVFGTYAYFVNLDELKG